MVPPQIFVKKFDAVYTTVVDPLIVPGIVYALSKGSDAAGGLQLIAMVKGAVSAYPPALVIVNFKVAL